MDAVTSLQKRLGTTGRAGRGVRRRLTFAAAAAGGIALAGVALWVLAGNGERHREPLPVRTGRGDGAPRPMRSPEPGWSTTTSTRAVPSTRFASNVLLALGAAFVIVATQAFPPDTIGWIAFGITGVGALVLTLAAAAVPGRGIVQWTLDAVVAALAIWTIVESLAFGGATLRWVSFGNACAMVALAIGGLVAHELSTERVVHSLEDVRTHELHLEPIA